MKISSNVKINDAVVTPHHSTAPYHVLGVGVEHVVVRSGRVGLATVSPPFDVVGRFVKRWWGWSFIGKEHPPKPQEIS